MHCALKKACVQSPAYLMKLGALAPAHQVTKTCTLAAQDAATTLGVFFEIVAQAKDAAAQNAMGDQGLQQFYVQFKTAFLHPNGTSRVRVTTFTRRRAPQKFS